MQDQNNTSVHHILKKDQGPKTHCILYIILGCNTLT